MLESKKKKNGLHPSSEEEIHFTVNDVRLPFFAFPTFHLLLLPNCTTPTLDAAQQQQQEQQQQQQSDTE